MITAAEVTAASYSFCMVKTLKMDEDECFCFCCQLFFFAMDFIHQVAFFLGETGLNQFTRTEIK